MRLRARLVLAFVCAQVGLSAAAGAAAWWWVDRSLEAQAVASAQAVGRVLGQGGFSLTPRILERMQELAGYRCRLLAPGEAAAADEVEVAAGAQRVAVAIATPEQAAARRDVLVGAAAVAALGSLLFAGLAMLIAARLSRPVEALAGAARRIGGGDLDTPIAVPASGEVAALARELDDMRRRLAELDRANRRAERLATLGTFTATIAHEVRNPLSAVRLAAQLLRERHGDQPGIALIMDEIERLDLIVDELVAHARGMDARPEPCDLAAVAADVVRLLDRQARHAGVALTASGGGRVRADPRRLRQLLLNLALNAIQAIQGSGVGTAVEIRVAADGLAVEDDGPGAPADLVPRLFDAFATGRSGGTGLGLHLAQAIAAAHGARLDYRRDGGRTAFVLSGLPPA